MTEKKSSWTSYFTKKVIVSFSVVATVFTIIGGIWAFEAHYATNKRVDGVAYAAKEHVVNLEVKIASALENQQHKADIKFLQFLYDKFNNDIFELKRQIRRYPKDQILKQDYEDLLRRRQEIKEKLDEAMKNIKVS